jgi:hypothetical protein
MEVTTKLQTQRDDRQIRLSLLAGIAVWFLHLNTIYALASLSCRWNWLPFRLSSLAGAQVLETIITLVAVLLLALLIYVPWRRWRAYQGRQAADQPHMLADTERDRRPLLAFVTMGLNGFLLLFAIALYVPIFALRACGQG